MNNLLFKFRCADVVEMTSKYLVAPPQPPTVTKINRNWKVLFYLLRKHAKYFFSTLAFSRSVFANLYDFFFFVQSMCNFFCINVSVIT